METTHLQKYIHSTPRKLRLVADMIRNLNPEQALETLRFTKKDAAADLLAAVQTALANAKGKGMEIAEFKAVEINEGPKMGRFRAGTRGRVKHYKKRMAHIRIVLTDEFEVQAKNQKIAKAPKTETEVTTEPEVIVDEKPKKSRKVAK